jgi:hypothetical protein
MHKGEGMMQGLVTNILMSPAAQKVDFWLGSIHVDGAGFREVVGSTYFAMCGFKGVKIVRERQPEGAAASYYPSTDTLALPNSRNYGASAVQKYHIVHEAIHAMQDITGGSWYSERGSIFTTFAENEAAAYVGAALYSLYSTGEVFTGSAHDEAFMIARSLQGRAGARVPEAQAKHLMETICDLDIYFTQGITMTTRTSANGL